MKEHALQLPKKNTDKTVGGKLTAHQNTYDQLRYAIMIGSIAPGESLTIRGLAQALGVSPTPVREAIRRLSTESALTVLDNRRVITPELNAQQFDALVLFRVHIEAYATEKAFPYINDVLVDQLEAIDNEMDDAIRAQDYELSVVKNQAFHSRLYLANPFQVYMPGIESIWLQLGPYSRIILQGLKLEDHVDYHKKLITALRNRNLEDAKHSISMDILEGIGKYKEEHFGQK